MQLSRPAMICFATERSFNDEAYLVGLGLRSCAVQQLPGYPSSILLRLSSANCGHEMERGDLERRRVPKPSAEHIHQHQEEDASGLGTRLTNDAVGVLAIIFRKR